MNGRNYSYPYEPIYDSARRPQERKKWDVFEDPPAESESGSTERTKWIDLGEKAARIFAYTVTFVLILGGAVVSKGTLMFMVAQIGGNSTQVRPFCNRYLDRNKQYQVVLPKKERVAWMWMIMFAFFAPQIATFLRSLRKLIYKSWSKPKKRVFAWVFVSESLMTIGIAIFVYVILPRLDSVKALMLTNGVCFIPGVLAFIGRVLRKIRNIELQNNPRSIPIIILDLICVVAQASAFIVWPLTTGDNILWLTIVSAILISCGWWENFAPLSPDYQRLTWFENSRYFIYVFVSWWKCLVFFASMVVIEKVREGETLDIFDYFVVAFQEHNITLKEVQPIILEQTPIATEVVDTGGAAIIPSSYLTPVWVFVINVLSTYVCYIVGKWACKINLQGFSYSLPINLTVPVALSILITMCAHYMADECAFIDTIPLYLFFQSPSIYDLNNFITKQQSWIWLFWLLSQAWITAHTWIPKCEKLAKTEKLYVRPMYEPFLIDQDLALNRRVDDGTDWRDGRLDDRYIDNPEDIIISEDFNAAHPDDSTTRIYACATMWHETEEEMMEFLKSIFRLDEDQCARRTVRERLGFRNRPDYYELETHIFFDDAFVRLSKDDNDPQINEFVKQLTNTIDKAASVVHEVKMSLRPPKKCITPYGGTLVWTLPGKTKMVAHLKDAKKIRKKKRWSQVMYMYYLLGHKLMERRDISGERKDVISENTFLLALDGDIDFQPKAVHLLVEFMKKNKNLGAACGRIHPLGSGPMVWYQMFEYAVGHWMQKATEHVIGCVLCSPGCFSLFRGKALMDDSVMCKYTTKSTRARHFVQYDQGEDRWLCTLLLQRGYRVEYAAASDAYTHCPEGFGEFYNQRRRWMPSTLANILDVLMNARHTVKINDNVSTGYICYQFLLLFGTVLGPGTIFLMLIGSFVAVFQWTQWTSFLWNAIPLLIFVITCSLFSGDKIQLFVAGVLSGVYALVMMAVLVGVILQATTDGVLAPASLFFFCMIGLYVITALLHPKEFYCLKFGLVYYVIIPSMFMLLVIYSVFNMNNVSWGTREVTILPTPQADPVAAEPPKEEKKSRNKISWLGARAEDNTGAIEFSIASIFKCLWCTRTDDSEATQLAEIKKHLAAINERLDRMEGMELDKDAFRRPTIHLSNNRTNITQANPIIPPDEAVTLGAVGGTGITSFHMTGGSNADGQSITHAFDFVENSWLDDEVLHRGEVEFLKSEEEEFWNGILDKYLHPIDDEKDKPRIVQDLKNLRDKVVLAFFMINALFVVAIFLLTLNRDTIYIQWPFGYSSNFTYMDDINQIWIYREYLQLEPIGIVFLAVFASLLAIQFVGMLTHRFQTFTQIVANTKIAFWKTSTKKLTEDEMLERNPVEVTKQLQKIKGAEDDEDVLSVVQPSRRKTVAWLDQRSAQPREAINDLDAAFQARSERIAMNKNYKGAIRRDTVMAIQRRQSKIRPSGLQDLNSRRSRLHDLDQQNSRVGPMGQRNFGYIG